MARLITFLINAINVLLLNEVKSYPLESKTEDIMLFNVGEDGNLTEIPFLENDFESSSELEIFNSEYGYEISENKTENIITVREVSKKDFNSNINIQKPQNSLENINEISIEDYKESNTNIDSYIKNRRYQTTYSPHSDDIITTFGVNPFLESNIVYDYSNQDDYKLNDDIFNSNNPFGQEMQFNESNQHSEQELREIEESNNSEQYITQSKFRKRQKFKTRKRKKEESAGSVSKFIVILTILLSLPVVFLVCWGIYELIISMIRYK